jgi:hypothetical protein
VRSEHEKYFEALEKHPRLLAGTQVPRLDGKEGNETLRDERDAASWQEALKQTLAAEVHARTVKTLEENQASVNMVHASIELFQKNPDLIPRTRQFDLELANRLTSLVKPYEVRVEGKLQGYSIPVQPIIEQLRSQVAAERAAKAASGSPAPSTGAQAGPADAAVGAAPGTPAPPGAASPPPAAAPVDGPQAGIPSQAGTTDSVEDFSTLFSTINPALANMRI